ncbi:helix-hairpin-helix domain-containing protein [Daejeonella oryzae]|uniref:helix-hairpin-helix domain-containing protein n=1 Tax=Daejeonella oryzae TaxID=1122943 RepID=UPI00040208F2|nr:helix-hairpin-helix domain-containing protein [Daejeonella oryzae]
MENKTIARTLRLLSQLMELHNENPFKIKSMANAAFKVDKLPFPVSGKSLKEMEEIEGLGKSTASKVYELIHTNEIKDMENLLRQTPIGVVDMLQIKGIGPKKIAVLWKDLGIENTGELYYACNENRLIEAKGFGLKTQEEIKKVIEFKMASSGRFLYAGIENFAEKLIEDIQNILKTDLISFTGPYRRKCEIIDNLDILCGLEFSEEKAIAIANTGLKIISTANTSIEAENEEGIRVLINFCLPEDFAEQLFRKTGSTEHVEEVEKLLSGQLLTSKTEHDIYNKASLQFIEPEMREGGNEIQPAKNHQIPVLIKESDLKGSLHNHSTWSDGVHSLEEMSMFCRDHLGLEYLGICDHSKSAFYAKGLNEIRVAAQHREIDVLNKKLAPFRIFKGIESDILYDGSLDYSDDILKTFDFVVASVHSILKMPEEKATQRLITAIENPYTTILGHPTGRMLLTRSGYPIDHKKVIDACAANKVVIEINSNPLRLDLDWRWHQYAVSKGVMLSINPDAHRKEGLLDMKYGIFTARKGGVSASNCLNSMNLFEISDYFEKLRFKTQINKG